LRLRGLDFDEFLADLCWNGIASVAAVLDVKLNMPRGYGFSIYDGLLVAAIVRAGCAILYMEDLQQGQMIEKLQIRNPFAGS
jgi:predicted nucleic acid-binding protein